MRIQRTIPPAAAPIYLKDFLNGLKGLLRGRKEIERFRSELKVYFGVRHCFLLSSGKAALTTILKALRDIYPARDEVLIPAFTCYSVPSAIIRAGLKVRLGDIDPDTLDFDYDQLLAKSHGIGPSPRLLAILPTHLFGVPSNILKLKGIFTDSETCIVEDAAQTMGGQWNNDKLGTIGDIGFFSLGRGKAFSTGEGGIILTDQDDIAESLAKHLKPMKRYGKIELARMILDVFLLVLFLNPLLFWFPKSLPFLKLGDTIFDPEFNIRRMSSFQAGLAKHWVKRLGRFIEDRSKCSIRWSAMTEAKPFSHYVLNADPNFVRFPVRINDSLVRNEILANSRKSGLGIMSTYPDSVGGIPELKGVFKDQDLLAARKIAKQLITLPVHPLLSEADKERIETLITDYSTPS